MSPLPSTSVVYTYLADADSISITDIYLLQSNPIQFI